jgi:hypothetical protein
MAAVPTSATAALAAPNGRLLALEPTSRHSVMPPDAVQQDTQTRHIIVCRCQPAALSVAEETTQG